MSQDSSPSGRRHRPRGHCQELLEPRVCLFEEAAAWLRPLVVEARRGCFDRLGLLICHAVQRLLQLSHAALDHLLTEHLHSLGRGGDLSPGPLLLLVAAPCQELAGFLPVLFHALEALADLVHPRHQALVLLYQGTADGVHLVVCPFFVWVHEVCEIVQVLLWAAWRDDQDQSAQSGRHFGDQGKLFLAEVLLHVLEEVQSPA